MVLLAYKKVSKSIQCSYKNTTSRFQIVKIENNHKWFEKTVLPGQTITFNSDKDDYLNIYTYEIVTMLLSDRIRCSQLS